MDLNLSISLRKLKKEENPVNYTLVVIDLFRDKYDYDDGVYSTVDFRHEYTSNNKSLLSNEQMVVLMLSHIITSYPGPVSYFDIVKEVRKDPGNIFANVLSQVFDEAENDGTFIADLFMNDMHEISIKGHDDGVPTVGTYSLDNMSDDATELYDYIKTVYNRCAKH